MRLLIETAPKMIQKSNGRMTPLDRDCLRAKILREELKKGDLLWKITLMVLPKKETQL